jgi:hypothetical protein
MIMRCSGSFGSKPLVVGNEPRLANHMAAPREADAHVVAAAIACAISECGEVVVDLLRQNQIL